LKGLRIQTGKRDHPLLFSRDGIGGMGSGEVQIAGSVLGGRIMARSFLIWYKAVVVVLGLGSIIAVGAETMKQPLVRIAELEIDPSQLPAYEDALKEEIATSIRVEPGVLKLFAVSVKDQPSQVRILEVYKDQEAYESHLQTPHFKKYKAETHGMVKSLKLIETQPILLGGK